MSVWYCIPSKRSPAEANICLDKWRAQGYKVALWRDSGDEPIDCDLMLSGEYPGYAQAVNALCREVLGRDPDCTWCVTGGDDIEPDQGKTADEIAAECSAYFKRMNGYQGSLSTPKTNLDHWACATFGVMQPTGDGHGIETICGSPWIGREFIERAYGGDGPFFHGYTHCFLDNELQEVAKKLGAFWQRPDLTHKHNNWMWTTGVKPAFLETAYSRAHWDKYLRLFTERKAAGFPGHEVCSKVTA